MSEDDKKIIMSWINNNPIGYKDGWEPYPLSLRIVNWIFYYNLNRNMFDNDRNFKQMYLNSLYHQCAYLSHFLEYHILANHLIKNGKALFFAGHFFEQYSWIQKGESIFSKELYEQILPDGSHFERSPMYHSIVLEDILDIINLIGGLAISPKIFKKNILIDIAQNMQRWLQYIIQPDREIPLFGDSSFQTALKLDQLTDYYNCVCDDKIESESQSIINSLAASGYHVFRSSSQYLIVDGGKLGVDYQPGHAHCDLFSYEYSYNDIRFLVDSGIGEYLNSELRQKARSINGHNCVVVNEMDQAEIWEVFRMGRRVEPSLAETSSEKNLSKFVGIYENQLLKKYAYTHKREILFVENDFFYIKDQVTGKKIFNIKSLLHFHPDCKIEIQGKKIKVTNQEKSIYILFPDSLQSLEIIDWFYVPEYGKTMPSEKVVITPDESCNNIVQYFIVPGENIQYAEKYLNNHVDH
jgi:uncharacterized heparinase superfamily protein